MINNNNDDDDDNDNKLVGCYIHLNHHSLLHYSGTPKPFHFDFEAFGRL